MERIVKKIKEVLSIKQSEEWDRTMQQMNETKGFMFDIQSKDVKLHLEIVFLKKLLLKINKEFISESDDVKMYKCFLDGDALFVVNDDFVNIQESPCFCTTLCDNAQQDFNRFISECTPSSKEKSIKNGGKNKEHDTISIVFTTSYDFESENDHNNDENQSESPKNLFGEELKSDEKVDESCCFFAYNKNDIARKFIDLLNKEGIRIDRL